MTKDIVDIALIGAKGVIGSVLQQGLSDHNLTLIDIEEIDDSRFLCIDVEEDYESLRESMQNKDVVINLAWPKWPKGKGDVNHETMCRDMYMGENVYRAAFEVTPHPRVILASSIHVAQGHFSWEEEPYASALAKRRALKKDELITVSRGLRPNSNYAAGKAHLEELGRDYAEKGLAVICARFGGINRENDPRKTEKRSNYHSSWLSHDDCVQFMRKCIEAELPDFSVFFAVSNNTYNIFDNSNAREILGYTPKDNSETF